MISLLLLLAGLPPDLIVDVEYKDATSVEKTIVFTETTIGEFKFVSPEVHSETKPCECKAAEIIVRTDAILKPFVSGLGIRRTLQESTICR